jgi:arginyl-tRNA synthetase
MASQGVTACPADTPCALLTEPAERELIRQLALFAEEIIAAAGQLDPARLTRYATDVATSFHRFYTVCRCMVDDENLMQARISLCIAARQVIANVLSMLRITAPETM